ncbi:MAG: SGNH/GDSL hydrolase family protein [Janthinobacterium lividum]
MDSRHGRRAVPVAVATVCAGLTALLTFGAATRGEVDATSAPVYTVEAKPDAPRPLELPAHPRVLIMGDSYTEGWGADPESRGFSYQIAQPLGWRLTRDGIGSTGFVDAGLQDQGNYPTRLSRHPRDAYDLVILQGGTNDEKLSTAEISAGLDRSVEVVRERYPSAQLVVMGPVAPYGTPSADRAKLNLALVDYTHARSIPYINAVAEHWFQIGEWRTLVDERKGHPNNDGYVRVAEHVVQDMRDLTAPAP